MRVKIVKVYYMRKSRWSLKIKHRLKIKQKINKQIKLRFEKWVGVFQVRGIACKILRARKHDVVGTEKKNQHG